MILLGGGETPVSGSQILVIEDVMHFGVALLNVVHLYVVELTFLFKEEEKRRGERKVCLNIKNVHNRILVVGTVTD